MNAIRFKANKLKRAVLNEKGSSLIMALVIILILVAISMAVLVMSVGNINLSTSSRKMNFSSNAQELIGRFYVAEVDKKLELAEQQTQTYFRNNYFSANTTELGNAMLGLKENSKFDETTVNAIKNEPPAVKSLLKSGLQAYYYTKFENEVKKPSEISQISNENKQENKVHNYMSSKLFDAYYEEAFSQVYYYLAYQNLLELKAEMQKNDSKSRLTEFMGQNGSFGKEVDWTTFTMPDINMAWASGNDASDIITKTSFGKSDVATVKSSFEKMTVDFQVLFTSLQKAENAKKMYASLKILPPTSEGITQKTTRSIFGNPIWANAITATQSIEIKSGSSCTVEGDIFAGGMTDAQEKTSVLVNGSNLFVEGNVYANGNVTLKNANDNKFEVKPRANETAILNKKKIFGESDYFLKLGDRDAFGYVTKTSANDNISSSITALIQTEEDIDKGTNNTSKETDMPYVLKDNLGGNLYTRGIVIDTTSNKANVNINGDTLFFDDIVNNSQSNSEIALNGYVIGLDAMGIDTTKFSDDTAAHFGIERSNDGSCIKNFKAQRGNKINIEAPMIFVPGSAIVYDDNKKPYKTGTGMVDFSNSGQTLSPYKYMDDIVMDPDAGNHSSERKSDLFVNSRAIQLGEAEATKKTYIEDNLSDDYLLTNKADSNIYVKLKSNQHNSYVTGTTFMKVKSGNNYKIGNNYMYAVKDAKTDYFNTRTELFNKYLESQVVDDSVASSDLKKIHNYEYLYRVFKSKTQYLGLWDISNLMNLVNRNIILSSESTATSKKYLTFEKTGIIVPQVKTYNLDDLPTSNRTDYVVGTNSGKVKEGIIFADGDLDLTASENTTFRGTIIANGKVTIRGNIRFIYDESVIARLFKSADNSFDDKYIRAAEFFQPGETGTRLYTQDRENKSARGRKILAGERLEIVKWKTAR